MTDLRRFVRPVVLGACVLASTLLVTRAASAQEDQQPSATPAATPATPAVEPDAQASEPGTPASEVELNLINLPTTMSLKNHQSYFRLTHRFARDLRRGDFGDLAQDFFSLDNGAVIGLEYRFGITSRIQAGVHRTTLSKTIQFSGRYDAWKQTDSMPVSISILPSIEGLANFHQNYQPGIGVTVGRDFGGFASVYATPMFVWHTHAVDSISHEGHDHDIPGAEEPDEHAGHDDTSILGFGGRFRIRPTVFISAEYAPRLSGYDPGGANWGVAIEKLTGGHTLQLNFTNAFGTTFGEIARGGSTHDVYLGFNLVRRF
jgi:hypothetical protein